MKRKTKVIDKFVVVHFIPSIVTQRNGNFNRRELNPKLSEAEAWVEIEEQLKNEAEGTFGEVEVIPAKHIKIVVKDESGLVVPEKQGILTNIS